MLANRVTARLSVLALLLASAGCVAERVVYVDRPRQEPAAQPAPEPRSEAVREDEDPPARVARLNYLGGAVSFRPAGLEEWGRARLNFPLKGGDVLWTDDDGRAELHVGPTALRLARDTSLALLRLDDQLLQLRLSRGTVELRIPSIEYRESVEVATPAGAVILDRIGSFRVDVDPDRDRVTVTVRRGSAEVSAGGQNVTVHADESLVLAGGEAPSYDITEAIGRNDFEDWCVSRDRREDRAESAARYVGRDMIGYEDLDENGTWRTDVTYGNVWVPRVSVGWAPYRDGRWAWVEPWGWTWIDDAPWGFAPFHYGRWAMVGGSWAWILRGPGISVRARPVYAPALVAFVGGSHFSASISTGGGVAWFPLGPREPYVPGYRCSPTYVRNVNVVQVTNVTNISNITNITYVNRGMATAVPNEVFRGGRPVHGAVVPLNPQALAGASVMGGAALAPRRDSLLPRPLSPGRVAVPPSADLNRPVLVRTAPPPAPVAFDARQRLLEAHPGRPLDRQALEGLRRQSPAIAASPVRIVQPNANAQTLRPARPDVRTPRPLAPQPSPAPAPRPHPVEAVPPRGDRPEEPRLERRPGSQPEPRRGEEPRRVETPRRIDPPRRAEEPRRQEDPRALEPRRLVEPKPRKDPERSKEPVKEKGKAKAPKEPERRPEERERR